MTATSAFPAQQDLTKMSARFHPAEIKADTSKLSEGDRKALPSWWPPRTSSTISI